MGTDSSLTVAPPQPVSPVSPPLAPETPADGHARHFATEHLHADLKGRSIRGGAVTLTAQGVKFVLQLGSTVVLARLLTPADFGLVAMVTALTGFVSMFKDAGLSMATVQWEEITHEQVSTLFWINVALSVVLMLVVAALAPVVVWFYGEPDLLYVTFAIASTFIFSGLGVQHLALLKRQMRFAALAAKDLTAMTAGVGVAVVLAWLGAGYWALIAMNATSSVFGLLIAWRVSGWIPGMPRCGAGVRPMLAFGGNLTGFNFVNYFARNADNVLIGWYWGAGPLGIYTKAYTLLMLPLQQARGPVTNVVLPALSRLQNEPARYRRYYSHALDVLCVVALPPFVALIALADWIVIVILGEKWMEAVNVFRWLGLVGIVQIALSGTGWLFVTQGRTGEQLRCGGITSALSVASFMLGLPYGIYGVAVSYALCGILVRAPLLCAFAGNKGPISPRAVTAPVANGVLSGAVVLVVALLMRVWSPLRLPHWNLLLASLTVLAAHLGVFALIHGKLFLAAAQAHIERHSKAPAS